MEAAMKATITTPKPSTKPLSLRALRVTTGLKAGRKRPGRTKY